MRGSIRYMDWRMDKNAHKTPNSAQCPSGSQFTKILISEYMRDALFTYWRKNQLLFLNQALFCPNIYLYLRLWLPGEM